MATKKETPVEQTEQQVNKATYSKDALLKSKRYANRRDALHAIIQDGEQLTLDEVKKRLDTFMKGKVN